MTEFRIGRREVILAATAFAVTPAAKAQAEEELSYSPTFGQISG